MTPKPSFIYFDVGGVLIKDFSKTQKMEELMYDLGITKDQSDQFEKVWLEIVESRVCLDYSVDSFIPVLKAKFNLNLPKDYSLLDDVIGRFERNEGIWPIVNQAKTQGGVGMLTNMYPGMLPKITEANLLDNFNWDAVIDSSVVGLQKPDKKIFLLAQGTINHAPEQILFIDNSQSNLDAAQSLNWQTFFYDSSDYENSNRDLIKYLEY